MNEIVIHTMSVFNGIIHLCPILIVFMSSLRSVHDCSAIRHAQDDELEI